MTAEEVDPTSDEATNTPTTGTHSRLERLAARALDNIAEGQAAAVSPEMAVMLSEKYSGPFVHPAVLSELDKIVGHGAERAFRLTEKEQEHRHEIEKLEANSMRADREAESADRHLVIILVFAFLTLCLIGAFVAIMTGHAAGGGLVAGAGAIITGAALLIARSRSKKGKE